MDATPIAILVLPLLIRLAVVTGLVEALDLRWRDLMVDNDSPRHCRAHQNGDSHVSPITPDLVQVQAHETHRSNDDDLIF
jgi:integrase